MTNLLIGFVLGWLGRYALVALSWYRRIPPELDDTSGWFEEEMDRMRRQVAHRKQWKREHG